MFIDGRHLLVIKAPEGRHVTKPLDPLIFEKVLDSVKFY